MIDAPDNPDFWKKWESGEWEPTTHAVLAQHLTPGSIFIDVGAWIGPVSRWALELGAHVVAYEPDPVAYDLYCQNLRDLHGWKIHKAAISNYSGRGQLDTWGHKDTRGELGNSMSRLGATGTETQVLAATTLIETTPNPALIKIDVEGGELDILPGLLPIAPCPILVAWHQAWWSTPFKLDLTGWEFQGPIGGFGQSLLTRLS